MQAFKKYFKHPLVILAVLAVVVITAFFAPSEKTIGSNLKLVLFHGAWVWVGKVAFAASGLFGLGYLVRRFILKQTAAACLTRSRAGAYTGLFFWFTYLPMSMLLMQLNWGGFFFAEARWKITFTLGIVALLLQIAFYLFDHPILTSVGNLAFGIALWWTLGVSDNVLHPDSPVAQSNSGNIQGFFAILVLLTLIFAAQIGYWLYSLLKKM